MMGWVTRLVMAALVLFGTMYGASAKDLGKMSADDIRGLQQRLTDAQCYSGPIDGLASPATEQAKKACPDQEPVLRIETGMHTALIIDIAVDSACSIIATASSDKTVRLWSLPDGRLKQTIRLPVGGVNGGKAYAVALSPDGRWLAAGGWDAFPDSDAVYLIDLTTGAVRRLGKFEDVVMHIVFSSDGQRVAVALGGKSGIRVLDVASGREVMSDRDYGDTSYGIAFRVNGGLVATSYDGYLRRYGPDLKMTNKVTAPDGKLPSNISIDPSGTRLALGYSDTPAVSILDAETLQPLAKAETGDLTGGDLHSTTWSRRGGLWAGGRATTKVDGTWRQFIRQFRPNGRRVGADIAIADNTVMDIETCGKNIAFGAANLTFGLVSAIGRVTQLNGPVTASDMRDKSNNSFTVSADGLMVRFGLSRGGHSPVAFDLVSARIETSPSVPARLVPAKSNGLRVTDWEHSTTPKLDGKPLKLEENETSRSLAIRPKLDGFVLGADWSLRAFDASGKQIWSVATPGTAWGLNLARSGDLVIAAFGDGTIRWYRWSDGKELLALFVYKPDLRWVAWTPIGYYMASPGGEDLIGWHINRGWEQAPDFFPASRFRDRFNRPDIVQKVLTTLDEDRAVTEADAEARRKPTDGKPIEAQLPPVIRILSPKEGTIISGNSVTLEYSLRSPSGLPVEAIDVLIDGRPLSSGRGLERVDEASQTSCPGLVTRGVARIDSSNPMAEVTCYITVPLISPSEDSTVGLIARAGAITSEPALVKLAMTRSSAVAADAFKPKLYVLSIGISDYADPTLRLGYPALDAEDFAKAMTAQSGGIYSKVETRILTNRQASREAIIEGFDWLYQQVTSRDMAMVFLAGHGTTDDRNVFWYLPADAKPTSIRATAVSQDDLRSTLQSLPSKAVLFLDTCHAGKAAGAVETATRGVVDVNSLVNDLASSENGVVTFASSTGRELSHENEDWGHGAFTKALLEGIADGKGDILHQGSITLSGLDVYITQRVKELTQGQQHPIMTKPATITNFAIAVVGK
jgi:WD40 repeat protein